MGGGARPARTLVGTAGNNVAVERWLWSGGPADGPFEIDYLALAEVDASGVFVAFILFEPDDARAAQLEAWSRWAAIDPDVAGWVTASGLVEAFNARDRDAIRSYYADDAVIVDHQRTGVGRVEGADAWVDAIAVYWEVAPDTRLELGWTLHACDVRGGVCTTRRTGTVPDGGAFEAEYHEVIVFEDGRIKHEELFELDALDQALARFEELRPDPLRIPENEAARAGAEALRKAGVSEEPRK